MFSVPSSPYEAMDRSKFPEGLNATDADTLLLLSLNEEFPAELVSLAGKKHGFGIRFLHGEGMRLMAAAVAATAMWRNGDRGKDFIC